MKSSRRQREGSVTIEACVAMPFFIVFFMLFIFLIRVAWASLDLNYAVNETARQIASVCYPLSFLNEAEDMAALEMGLAGGIHSVGTGAIDDAATDGKEGSFSDTAKGAEAGTADESDGVSFAFIKQLAAGCLDGPDSGSLLNETVSTIIGIIMDKSAAKAAESLAGAYYHLREEAEYAAADSILSSYLSDTNLSDFCTKTSLLYARFPQSDYRHASEILEWAGEAGAAPISRAVPLTADDVVISAECVIRIPLPFIGGKAVRIRHTAAERACMHGYERYQDSFLNPFGSDGGQNADPGGDGDGDPGSRYSGAGSGDGGCGPTMDEMRRDLSASVVYVTRTGTRYHRQGCRYLKRSCIAVKEEEAAEKGYLPCMICNP